jgi:hypothetical protein
MDQLYETIQEEGYRPNRGALYDEPKEVESPHELEPLVLIGRSGEVYWTEGFHRLIIAKLLETDRIPVYVVRRHEQWQHIRDRMCDRSTEPDRYADHPDVEDIRS